MRRFVLLLTCFVASPVLAGEATTLSGEAIKTRLGGSLLALDTPVGTTVSVRIGHDGMMSGDAGTAMGAVLGSAKDRGRWSVVNDQVCFKWFRWFDAEERCVTITVDGPHITWRRNDGDSGTGTIVEENKPVTKPAVTLAEAKKPAAISRKREDQLEPRLATNKPDAEVKRVEAAPKAVAQIEKPMPPQAPVIEHHNEVKTVALQIPEPHVASRPARIDKIAVASVKPQFFMSPKANPPKVWPAKVEVAKAQPSKVMRKPFRVAGVDPSDVLNIRNGPSSEFQSVGAIPPDSRGITITGPCQNEWCPVKHRTLVGWVNRRYLAEETAANTAAVSEPNYWDPAP